MSKRIAVLVLVVMLVDAAPTHAQNVAPRAQAPRERATLAIATNGALEGSGPWFAPGLRVGVPLGARTGLDLESSAVFGGRLPSPHGSINSFFALNVRRLRAARASDGTSRYLMYGLRYTPIEWPPERQGNRYNDLAFTFGHGWDQVFSNGGRFGGEVGFSGGRGFLFFATFVAAFPLHR